MVKNNNNIYNKESNIFSISYMSSYPLNIDYIYINNINTFYDDKIIIKSTDDNINYNIKFSRIINNFYNLTVDENNKPIETFRGNWSLNTSYIASIEFINNYNGSDLDIGTIFYIYSNSQNISGYYYIETLDLNSNSFTYNTKLKLEENIGNILDNNVYSNITTSIDNVLIYKTNLIFSIYYEEKNNDIISKGYYGINEIDYIEYITSEDDFYNINIKTNHFGKIKLFIPNNSIYSLINDSYLYNSQSNTTYIHYEEIDGLKNNILVSDNLKENMNTCSNIINYKTLFNNDAIDFDDLPKKITKVSNYTDTKIYIDSILGEFNINEMIYVRSSVFSLDSNYELDLFTLSTTQNSLMNSIISLPDDLSKNDINLPYKFGHNLNSQILEDDSDILNNITVFTDYNNNIINNIANGLLIYIYINNDNNIERLNVQLTGNYYYPNNVIKIDKSHFGNENNNDLVIILNPYSVKATILGKEDNHLIINYKKQTTSLYDVNADGIFNINDRIISNTGSCTYKYDLTNDIIYYTLNSINIDDTNSNLKLTITNSYDIKISNNDYTTNNLCNIIQNKINDKFALLSLYQDNVSNIKFNYDTNDFSIKQLVFENNDILYVKEYLSELIIGKRKDYILVLNDNDFPYLENDEETKRTQITI